MVTINTKYNLTIYARNLLTSAQEEEVFYGIYNATYDSVKKGFFKGYILPTNDRKGYFAVELMSIDGRLYYGICVYNYDTYTIYFTDWYAVCSMNMNALKIIPDPSIIIPPAPGSEDAWPDEIDLDDDTGSDDEIIVEYIPEFDDDMIIEEEEFLPPDEDDPLIPEDDELIPSDDNPLIPPDDDDDIIEEVDPNDNEIGP